MSADTQTARLAEIAAKKIALERKETGGQSSGKTLFIIAETMRQVQHSTRRRRLLGSMNAQKYGLERPREEQ